jgi:hypothetical protein
MTTVMQDHASDDVVQKDFIAGPRIVDLKAGEVFGTWPLLMAMTSLARPLAPFSRTMARHQAMPIGVVGG